MGTFWSLNPFHSCLTMPIPSLDTASLRVKTRKKTIIYFWFHMLSQWRVQTTGVLKRLNCYVPLGKGKPSCHKHLKSLQWQGLTLDKIWPQSSQLPQALVKKRIIESLNYWIMEHNTDYLKKTWFCFYQFFAFLCVCVSICDFFFFNWT